MIGAVVQGKWWWKSILSGILCLAVNRDKNIYQAAMAWNSTQHSVAVDPYYIRAYTLWQHY